MNNVDRIRKGLSPERKRKIATRAATIIAEERSLQGLRRAHKLTQKKMAEALGIGQDSVSRLEQRSDLLISTLRNYVEAMGGNSRSSRSSRTRSRWCSPGSRPWTEMSSAGGLGGCSTLGTPRQPRG